MSRSARVLFGLATILLIVFCCYGLYVHAVMERKAAAFVVCSPVNAGKQIEAVLSTVRRDSIEIDRRENLTVLVGFSTQLRDHYWVCKLSLDPNGTVVRIERSKPDGR